MTEVAVATPAVFYFDVILFADGTVERKDGVREGKLFKNSVFHQSGHEFN